MEYINLKPKNTADVLRDHAMRYPVMTPRDVIKLIYQSTFGPGHMISDKNAAIEYLRNEINSAVPSISPMIEEIGGEFSRVYLRQPDGSSLDESTQLFGELFLYSAKNPAGTVNVFDVRVESARKIAAEGLFSFDSVEFDRYLEEYRSHGIPVVSHSEAYRNSYHPAYRVIRQEFAALFPVLVKLKKNGHGIIAIDGFCASGKSTLAEKLAEFLGANLIHTDDFFLPPEKRTAERFAEPGGNVDYERFKTEVIDSLEAESVTFGIFDCCEMKITETKTLPKTDYTIIEGAYSNHPYFGNYADVRIFVETSSDEQLKRIVCRDGEKALGMFTKRWIPFEQKYEAAFGIKSCADYVIET